MAWPPDAQPTDMTNSTPARDVHPAWHNDTNDALNEIITILGGDPSLGYATVENALEAIKSLAEGHASRHHTDGDDPLLPENIGAALDDHTHDENMITLATIQEVTGRKSFVAEADADRAIEVVSGDNVLSINGDGSLVWQRAGVMVAKLVSSDEGLAISGFTPPASPTYVRSGVAYDDSQTSVAANTPIYVTGIDGSAIRIDEGTTNLFSSGKSEAFTSAETVSDLIGTYTVSVGSGGSLTLTGATTGTVEAGEVLSFTLTSTGSVTFTPNDSPVYCQLEQKSYATWWHMGGAVRGNPTLTIPLADVLTPTEGTLDMWVQVAASMSRSTTDARLFHIPYNTDYGIYVKHNGDGWNLNLYTALGVGSVSATVPNASVIDGWHLFSIVWSETEAVLLIDGVRAVSIATPSLPVSFDDNMIVGNWATTGSNMYINAAIDSIRLSSIARSDDDVLRSFEEETLSYDQYTTYRLLMNDSLSTGTTTSISINSMNFDQGAAIVSPSGGSVIDVEARESIESILDLLRARGDIAE